MLQSLALAISGGIFAILYVMLDFETDDTKDRVSFLGISLLLAIAYCAARSFEIIFSPIFL